jgi:hypothetical protein
VTPSVAKSKADEIVSRSQLLASTVAGDGPALRSAQSNLNDLSWVTVWSRASLQDESARLDHARTAVADVKSAADDYRLLGSFMQTYFQVFVDWDKLAIASQNNDSLGYANALLLMRSDVAISLQQLTTLSYLPSAYRDQLTAVQALVGDLKQEQLARTNGDQAGLAAATKAYDADLQEVNNVDYSGTATAIRSHYQHYRDDFNTEMDKATT